MLEFSAAAYCAESDIQAWTCGHCENAGNFNGTSLLYDSGTNTFGYVGVDTSAEMST